MKSKVWISTFETGRSTEGKGVFNLLMEQGVRLPSAEKVDPNLIPKGSQVIHIFMSLLPLRDQIQDGRIRFIGTRMTVPVHDSHSDAWDGHDVLQVHAMLPEKRQVVQAK